MEWKGGLTCSKLQGKKMRPASIWPWIYAGQEWRKDGCKKWAYRGWQPDLQRPVQENHQFQDHVGFYNYNYTVYYIRSFLTYVGVSVWPKSNFIPNTFWLVWGCKNKEQCRVLAFNSQMCRTSGQFNAPCHFLYESLSESRHKNRNLWFLHPKSTTSGNIKCPGWCIAFVLQQGLIRMKDQVAERRFCKGSTVLVRKAATVCQLSGG